MCNVLTKALLVITLSVAIAVPVTAAEITNAIVFAFRDYEGASPVFTGQGDNFSFGVANVIPDSSTGTIVSAYNSDTGTYIDTLPVYPQQGRPGLFGQETTFSYAQNNGWLTSWELTISNGPDTATRYTPDRTGVERMEFVRNLSISGPATSPTVTWNLPVTGPTVTGVRYELWNNDTNQVLSGENSVPIGSNAVSLSLSNLQVGTNYAVRIIPEHRISGATASRSSNWLGWEAKIGEAQGTVLELTTGSPAGAMQTVDTPSETFLVEFDYKFTTETGTLSIFLDELLIGSELSASDQVVDDFLHALFEVEDESLLGLTAASLLFQLDGPTGSNVLIDNIIFPGLLNRHHRLRLLFILAITLLASVSLAAEPYQGKVIGISDDDTITVLHDGKQTKIRLYGIDTPERRQAFGNRAKQFTSGQVFGKTVTAHGSVWLVFVG